MADYRNWILNRLNADDRAALLERARLRPLESNQTIFTPGDPVEQVWFPESGVISVIVESESGLQAEAGLSGREGAAGLLEALGSGVIASRGVVQAPGSAWVVPASACRAIHARSADFRALAQLADEFHALEGRQSLFCRSYHPTEARMARWLLEVLDRSEAGAVLPMTQEVLAAMLAVQRTTVSTTAVGLRERGVIATGRGKIEVTDQAGLEGIACDCRAALKALSLRLHGEDL